MPGSVLILGGRSDIGLATAHVFAAAGHNIQLAARHAQTLSAEQTDLAVRYGVNVDLVEFDALDTAHHEAFAKALQQQFPHAAIHYAPDPAVLIQTLQSQAREGDLILSMGAGNITTLLRGWPASEKEAAYVVD